MLSCNDKVAFVAHFFNHQELKMDGSVKEL